ncbi:uncharacterized protein LOC129751686 isoform X5 [Uranotaenia lowii]|uniref:uncharacterized protein LOC129751686 isoform X5 n=1 Tax=Uranotaenia lowii TaxID=190385 RepID=UPI00247A029B|nr:uncharacterized protein LOC129751686 isoform X5 [Uranotaenia lowii]XP_055603322.1 uncharacterized protein LOC129751686 isoform X5 [Uranotaenia lowii]
MRFSTANKNSYNLTTTSSTTTPKTDTLRYETDSLSQRDTLHNRRRHFFIFRIKKVKNTASYIVGKVHRRFGTLKMHQRRNSLEEKRKEGQTTLERKAVETDRKARQCEKREVPVLKESPASIAVRKRSMVEKSESPLSYRASLFDERQIQGCDLKRSTIASRTKFSPQDFPISWFEGGKSFEQCFGQGPFVGQEEAFQVFNNKAHLFHKNKTISGRKQLFAKNIQPFNSLQRESTLLKKQNMFGSCPEINSGTLKSQISHKSKISNRSHRSMLSSKSSKLKSKIVQLLERNNDEKTEMDILQEYFDTMSYTDIIKDTDFKNYLIKKKYMDIMDYIYNSSGSELDRSEIRSNAASVPVSNNDCDSVKKEKLLAEIPKKYYSCTNPQVFCKQDQNFERYYQKYGTVPSKESSRIFGLSTFRSQYYTSTPVISTTNKQEIPCYVTIPKKTSRCKRTYQQVREFCEKSLMKYTTLKPAKNTIKLIKVSDDFTEKAYTKVINDFVRKRGFENTKEYLQYYYGDFLNKKPFKNKRAHQFNSLPPPPYSSSNFQDADTDNQFQSLESKPITLRTTSTANDSGVDSSSNFTSLIFTDSFKNFDYVNLTMMNHKNRKQSSSARCQLNEKPAIFRPVGSDDEEILPQDESLDKMLLGGLIATSDETNLPYIFDDIGIYESIKSIEKERIRAEVRSRKNSLVGGVATTAGGGGSQKSNSGASVVALAVAAIATTGSESDSHGEEEVMDAPTLPRPLGPLRTVGGRRLLNTRALSGYQPPPVRKKEGYRDEMLSEEMSSLVPPGLQGKADILFGNLHELYTFHNDTFLKDLENCISTTELVALCFVQRRDTFFRLYSYYCQNIPRSEQLRETLVDTHLFLQECQMKLGHKLPLAAYLLKPVQRITKYQLLLKDLLKFSDTGTCSRELQKALDCMLVVLKCVNDSMHQIAITGFPADLSQQGELLLQDSFQVWTESKKDLRLRLKTQHRHIFLYQKAMLFCKQGSKTGHNKSTYQFKHWLQMSQIGLTESVRGDPRRFEVWLQGRQEVHTIQASTVEIKNKWVAEIKRVLLNQLEELKGEKIKQYGLNHKPLRHTGSWEVPPSLHGTPNRTFSCDQQPQVVGPLSTNSLQHHVGSMAIHHQLSLDHSLSQQHHQQPQHQQIGAGDSMLSATGISSSSSEHDNQETNAWSSDYSNSEDEFTHGDGDGVLPGHKFISLADYCAMGNSEVSMKEGDIVELLKIGCAGWWFVKVVGNGLEGWAPAAYLEPMNRKSNRLRGARSQDKLNEH